MQLIVDFNGSQLADIPLQLGDRSEKITVSVAPTHVETADTQIGEVIPGSAITAVPLNGRRFTDLLALRPGVAPTTTITGNSIQAAGAAILAPTGDLNPGTISINGRREYANGFTVYAGGRMNVVTKSGTNQFHGSAFEFLPNTDFASRKFFSFERAVYECTDSPRLAQLGGEVNVLTFEFAMLRVHGKAEFPRELRPRGCPPCDFRNVRREVIGF
jgi:hypothetical protein